MTRGVTRGVFISCSARQKEALGRPVKALLAENGLRFIVSDEPRPEGAWTPEEKVDAYLALSDAVVVFATGDLEDARIGTPGRTSATRSGEPARSRVSAPESVS